MKKFIFIFFVHSVVIAQNKVDLITNNAKYNYTSTSLSATLNISSNSKNAYALNPNTSKIIQRENYSIQNRTSEFENKKIDLSSGYNISPIANNRISKSSSALSFAIYNPEKSEIIYSKQIYAGEKLVNGEIQRFNNENELIENALYEDGICKTLWQKTDNTEIHWQASPFSENSEVIIYSGNSLFSAKYPSNTDKSSKVTTHVTTSNELGTITFQSIQKNFQPNFRSITNIEFTSFTNTTIRCWCKNENDEVYLQFPYASFYPSGHIQLRGNIYVNICKKDKVKPFGKWYKYDQFGNIIGTENYLSLKEGIITVAPPECEEF
jgi:hypothetical protein